MERDRKSARLRARQAEDWKERFQGWLIEEIKEQQADLALIEAGSDSENRHAAIDELRLRLREIRDDASLRVFESLDELISEVLDEDAWLDAVEAHDRLDERLCRLDALERELLRTRDRVRKLWVEEPET